MESPLRLAAHGGFGEGGEETHRLQGRKVRLAVCRVKARRIASEGGREKVSVTHESNLVRSNRKERLNRASRLSGLRWARNHREETATAG